MFNGSSSNIFNSDRTSTQTTTITLSAWVKTSDTSSSMQILQTESLWLRANQVWRIDNANGTGNYKRFDYSQSTIATGNYDATFIQATGGTVTTDGSFKIHTFTGDGNFVVQRLLIVIVAFMMELV